MKIQENTECKALPMKRSLIRAFQSLAALSRWHFLHQHHNHHHNHYHNHHHCHRHSHVIFIVITILCHHHHNHYPQAVALSRTEQGSLIRKSRRADNDSAFFRCEAGDIFGKIFIDTGVHLQRWKGIQNQGCVQIGVYCIVRRYLQIQVYIYRCGIGDVYNLVNIVQYWAETMFQPCLFNRRVDGFLGRYIKIQILRWKGYIDGCIYNNKGRFKRK